MRSIQRQLSLGLIGVLLLVGLVLAQTSLWLFDLGLRRYLAEGLRKVDGELTGEKLRSAIESICDFKDTFIDGKICYSKDQHEGFSKDSLVTVEISGGKFKSIH